MTIQRLLIHALWVTVWLSCSSAGCSSSNNDPKPATSSDPTTLNTFDAYMVGTWQYQLGTSTFKSNGKSSHLSRSDGYDYTYVFKSDHTFTFTGIITGATGTNTVTANGKWATSITAGSKPTGSFNFPTIAGSGGFNKPVLPFSFVLSPSTGGQEICYIVYFNGNDIEFDWLSSDQGLETAEIWTKIK